MVCVVNSRSPYRLSRAVLLSQAPSSVDSTAYEYPLMLDMRVIFADMSVGLQGLTSVRTEGSAWLIPICV